MWFREGRQADLGICLKMEWEVSAARVVACGIPWGQSFEGILQLCSPRGANEGPKVTPCKLETPRQLIAWGE